MTARSKLCRDTPHCRSRRRYGDGECGCYHDSLGEHMNLDLRGVPLHNPKAPRTEKWCLNCGKYLHRCRCRETLSYYEPVPVQAREPEPTFIRVRTLDFLQGKARSAP